MFLRAAGFIREPRSARARIYIAKMRNLEFVIFFSNSSRAAFNIYDTKRFSNEKKKKKKKKKKRDVRRRRSNDDDDDGRRGSASAASGGASRGRRILLPRPIR